MAILLLDGTPAVFSNWVEDASNNISRDSNVTVTGDLQLNGTLKDASGNARVFSNWTIDGNEIKRDSNVTINGDLQLNGTLKNSSGADRVFSNWGVSGENIYRESKVGIGMDNPLHTLDISGDLNVVGNVTVNSVNATESFNYIAPIEQLQNVNEEPSWTGNVSTSIGFDELIDGNIPESLDTLKEIAELVKDISNSNALEAGLGLKANKHSPIFTGNVGIGQVANVSYALDISGDVNISSGALKLNGQTPVYSNWTVHSNGSDIYRPSGNVGIGTTSPRCPLNTNKLFTSSDDTIPNYVGDIDGNKTCDLFLGKSKSNTNNYWGIWMGTVWNSSWGYPSYIQAGSTSNHYPLLLNPNGGNVGIGTTSPSQKLDIQGNGASPAQSGRIRFTDTDTAENARNWFVGPYRSSDSAFQITPSASKGGASPDTTKHYKLAITVM